MRATQVKPGKYCNFRAARSEMPELLQPGDAHLRAMTVFFYF
jgi:hypothetical protein